MLRICLMVSGGLGLTILRHLLARQTIVAVFTDKGSTDIVAFCKENNLLFFAGNPRTQDTSAFRSSIDCDVLLSVNYLFIIGAELINLPKLFAVNVHGSLLPKYRGRTPHIWAIINGETKTGITAHLIEEGVDTGAIIHQVEVPIAYDDTGASVLKKYAKLYPQFIDEVLEIITESTLTPKAQDEDRATYFGKRTPADGMICWHWHRERIRNWVRAQAAPYPGAFTFLNNNKITIHKAEFSDCGFSALQENGTVLHAHNGAMIVKTPNGAVRLTDFTMDNNVEIKTGDILR